MIIPVPQPRAAPALDPDGGASRAPERADEAPASERRLDFRARVLVVEDENDLRELIARWLELRGYQVVEAADGRDAVDLLQAGLEPDVILLDLGMPGMDGRTFLAWLRADEKHRHLPVIVASAYLDDAPPMDAQRTFAKPFRPEALERELALLVSGE